MLYWLSKPTKRLLKEMSVGVIFFNVVLGIAAVLFLKNASTPVLPVLKGLCVGAAAAILMLVHMADTTERVLTSGDPDYAKKSTIAQSMIRKVFFLAAIVISWYVLKADPLAIVIGTMGLKAGAYLQPLIHRVSGAKDEPYTEIQEMSSGNGTSEAEVKVQSPKDSEAS